MPVTMPTRSNFPGLLFTVVVNHRAVLRGVSLAEARRAATWYANRVPGVTVSVGLL